MNTKVLNKNTLQTTLKKIRRKKKTIAFTNGTFDILHAGHVQYLQKAKKTADILVVGVNSDKSVKSYKGPKRPINSQVDRLTVLTGLECVDYAIVFSEPTPLKLIQKILPDVLVKGADWKIADIVGAKDVLAAGGKVRRIKFLSGRSSTRIIKALNLEKK